MKKFKLNDGSRELPGVSGRPLSSRRRKQPVQLFFFALPLLLLLMPARINTGPEMNSKPADGLAIDILAARACGERAISECLSNDC